MIKQFLLLALTLNFLFAYEDLGTYGELKEIKERDLMDLFTEKANALNYNQLEEDIKKNINKTFKIKSKIQACMVTKERSYEPLVDIKEDVKVPFTDLKLKEKNSKYNILNENNLFIPFNIIFIDADDEVQVELARVYKQQLKEKLEIYVVKGDILSLSKFKAFEDVKIARDGLELKAFNVQCLPSIYTQKDYQFQIVEYNPNDLIKSKNEDKK